MNPVGNEECSSMKKTIFFTLMVILFLSTGFAFRFLSISEFLSVEKNIELKDFAITYKSNSFSIADYWSQATKVKFLWTSESGYEKMVEKIFRNFGFLIQDSGEVFNGKITTLSDNFLFWEFHFRGKTLDNRQSLVQSKQFQTEFTNLLIDQFSFRETQYQYLVIVLSNKLPDTNGIFLYNTPDFSIWRFNSRNIQIKTEKDSFSIQIENLPIQIIDLEETTYKYTLHTTPISIQVKIDGEVRTTPFEVYLKPGVHKLEYSGETRFFYLSEELNQVINVLADTVPVVSANTPDVASGTALLRFNVPANITIYQEEKLLLQTEKATSTTVELKAGKYRYSVTREGFYSADGEFEILPEQPIQIPILLKNIPGAVFQSALLETEFDRTFLTDKWVILNLANKAFFFPLFLYNDQKNPSIIDSKILQAEGSILRAAHSVYYEEKMVFQSVFPIVWVFPVGTTVWIFDSAKNLTVLDVLTDKTVWKRTLDYLPLYIKPEGKWIGILDVFGSFYLLDSSKGYFETLKVRLGKVTAITKILPSSNDPVSSTSEIVEIYFSNGTLLTYSLKTRQFSLKEIANPVTESVVEQKTDGLYFKGKKFYTFYENPKSVFIAHEKIAVLYSRSMQILFSPVP